MPKTTRKLKRLRKGRRMNLQAGHARQARCAAPPLRPASSCLVTRTSPATRASSQPSAHSSHCGSGGLGSDRQPHLASRRTVGVVGVVVVGVVVVGGVVVGVVVIVVSNGRITTRTFSCVFHKKTFSQHDYIATIDYTDYFARTQKQSVTEDAQKPAFRSKASEGEAQKHQKQSNMHK